MAVRRSAIAEELTCPICQDEFDDPRILPCGHCYCRTCVVQLSNTAVLGAFPCPECRNRTVLPSNDPNQLPKSLLALRMKEKLQWQCEQLCSKHDEPMKLFCCDCKLEVCISCALTDHREHNYQLMNEGKTVNDKTSSTTTAISPLKGVHPVPSSPHQMIWKGDIDMVELVRTEETSEENLRSSCSICCVCCLALLLVFILLYLVASPIAIITVTATRQPTDVSGPCSTFINRTTAVAYSAASFLLITVCLCCTITCCGLCLQGSYDESGLGTCCCCLLVILLFLVMLALLASFIAENVVVFKDISGVNCGEFTRPSFISAILIDVAVGLVVLILLFYCCIKCCAKLVN